MLYQTSNKVNSHSVVNSRVSIEAARSLRGSVCGTLLSVDDKQVIDNCQLFQLIVMKWGNLSSRRTTTAIRVRHQVSWSKSKWDYGFIEQTGSCVCIGIIKCLYQLR